MTTALNVLLKRILPIELKEPKDDQEPSRNLMVLLNRVETRKWKEETEVEISLQLETLHDQLALIKHTRDCEQCLLMLQLDVERYMGNHSPWFLNVVDEYADTGLYDDEEDNIWRTCPRPRDYKIGSYWTPASEEIETKKFIMDRFTWAEGWIKKEVKAADTFLSVLKDWNLTSPLPPYNSFLGYWYDDRP